MNNHKKAVLAALGLSAALLGAHARAEVVLADVGGVTMVKAIGTNVTYTFALAEIGLYGPWESVSITGNTLSFAPGAFDVAGFGLLEDTLFVSVSAHSGYQLTSFSLTEGGSYTAGAYLDVDSMFEVRDSYAPSSNHVEASILESLGGSGSWNAGTGIVTPPAGWGANGVFDAATLVVTNLLVAQSASISKDYVNLYTIATPVPEAETYTMMLAGLGLIGFMARRHTLRSI